MSEKQKFTFDDDLSSPDESGFKFSIPGYTLLLIFLILVLKAGEPDLLDAIIQRVMP